MYRVAADHSGGGTKTDSMFSNLLNRGSQLFMEGVKNLVPKKHNLPLTKVLVGLLLFNFILLDLIASVCKTHRIVFPFQVCFSKKLFALP